MRKWHKIKSGTVLGYFFSTLVFVYIFQIGGYQLISEPDSSGYLVIGALALIVVSTLILTLIKKDFFGAFFNSVFFCVFIFGSFAWTSEFMNGFFDSSVPVSHQCRVTKRSVETFRLHKSYYLEFDKCIPKLNTSHTYVDSECYDLTQVGEPLILETKTGFLKWEWLYACDKP